jgi:hypothetical protein
MEVSLFTIDKILNVKINPENYLNEFNALMQLKTGMIALYNSVRPTEIHISKQKNGKNLFLFGSNDLVPQQIEIMLPSYFHWFGNSLCNYARLTGYIVAQEQGHVSNNDMQLEPARRKIKKACDAYVQGLPEIQEILRWRNKVSAHYAITDPRKDDNIATLDASIIYPVGFAEERFRTGLMIFSQGNNNETYDSEIPKWSLTELFENLINRFWPDVRVNS